eukprot:TRINITY_DN4007_c0_g2_i6.p1 TRINITY_DN4007_c0_g2~~TRINITY_DN4007_c0_g2_i6.p1  ORF type:complete len:206 (+),score=27.75 TRINITY_DN4007_c0_g2_i6:185-802(+)
MMDSPVGNNHFATNRFFFSGYSALIFLVVYMICSPIFGTLSDYGISRKGLILFGVAAWSLSASAAYFVESYAGFLCSRAFVGIGEASFVVITPSLLSDLFPPSYRNGVLTAFYTAIPVGSAIGFILGGLLSTYYGWRQAFLFTGLPGLVISIFVFWMRDPGQGNFETKVNQVGWSQALKIFWSQKVFVIIVIGIFLSSRFTFSSS